MVLTRRAAAAAAAAAASTSTAASAPASESPTTPNTTADTTADTTNPAPVPHNPRVQMSTTSSSSTTTTTTDVPISSPPLQSPCRSKMVQLGMTDVYMRRAVARRLWLGHCVACVAVLVVVHAARVWVRGGEGRRALPWHAVFLAACVVPGRVVLALDVHGVGKPEKRSGMVLALSAAVVFASNALHVLATLIAPRMLRVLILCAAVDTSAMWLRMTVVAREPVVEPFVLVFAMLQSAADIFLAGVVGGSEALQRLFWPFLGMRFVVNVWLVGASARAIVRREEKGR
eukprot:GFKZ01010116.1.p1 GENE.GFKZ01010116.1~~GFKZ01010116.1.p1  ORF type:complete len:317 (+),score=36.38 GFKZ01010116.1:92-952(+)